MVDIKTDKNMKVHPSSEIKETEQPSYPYQYDPGSGSTRNLADPDEAPAQETKNFFARLSLK